MSEPRWTRQDLATVAMALAEFRTEYGPGEERLAARVNAVLRGPGEEFVLGPVEPDARALDEARAQAEALAGALGFIDAHYSGSLDSQPLYVKVARTALAAYRASQGSAGSAE